VIERNYHVPSDPTRTTRQLTMRLRPDRVIPLRGRFLRSSVMLLHISVHLPDEMRNTYRVAHTDGQQAQIWPLALQSFYPCLFFPSCLLLGKVRPRSQNRPVGSRPFCSDSASAMTVVFRASVAGPSTFPSDRLYHLVYAADIMLDKSEEQYL